VPITSDRASRCGINSAAGSPPGTTNRRRRGDNEVPGVDRVDAAADLLDDTDELVPHGTGAVDGPEAAVGPQVRAADAGGDDAHDRVAAAGVRPAGQDRLGKVFDADVPLAVDDSSKHELVLLESAGPCQWLGCRTGHILAPHTARRAISVAGPEFSYSDTAVCRR
jgi:hypothetical protein